MRSTAIALVVLFVLSMGEARAQALTPREFRDEISRELLSLKPNLCVQEVDDLTLHIGKSSADCDSLANIDNSYSQYLLAPEDKDTIVRRFAQMMMSFLDQPEILERAPERLVLVLRPSDYLAQMPDTDVVSWPFAGDMRSYLMVDFDDKMQSVTRRLLKEWKLSENDALALAKKNLPIRMGELQSERVQAITLFSANSGLATGALTMPDACTATGPQRLIFLMNRDSYLAVDQADAEGVAQLARVAGGMIRDNNSMSRTLLACNKGSWIASEPK
jgi:hypothetical protein